MDEPGLSRDELKELLSLTKENNKILRNMRTDAHISFWVRLLVIVALVLLWAYCYVYFYPYIISYLNILKEVGSLSPNAGAAGTNAGTPATALPSPAQIQQYLQSLHPATKP